MFLKLPLFIYNILVVRLACPNPEAEFVSSIHLEQQDIHTSDEFIGSSLIRLLFALYET